MTPQQIVSPFNAPFSIPVIPTGMSVPLTAGEVTALNTAYPRPPYGQVYWNPNTGASLP